MSAPLRARAPTVLRRVFPELNVTPTCGDGDRVNPLPARSPAATLPAVLRSMFARVPVLLSAAWALSGTALFAVLVALAAGGGAFLAAGPSAADAASGAAGRDPSSAVALKAADDSRTMFTLLSDALTSSASGLTSATSAVPQIFDSIDTARAGAESLSASLESTGTASATLARVSQTTSGWSTTFDQASAMASTVGSVRASLRGLRTSVATSTDPADVELRSRIDAVLARTGPLSALETVPSLDRALGDLAAAAARGSAGLTSARTAARELRDGLTTLARARPGAQAAVASLDKGVTQLGIALKSIDAQLALVQSELRAQSPASTGDVTLTATTAPADRAAYALVAGGVAGAIAYLLAAAFSHRFRRPEVVHAAAPLANLTRELPIGVPTDGDPGTGGGTGTTGGAADTLDGFPVIPWSLTTGPVRV